MASRFHAEGCEVLLAARMSKKLQSSLPQDIRGESRDVLVSVVCFPHKLLFFFCPLRCGKLAYSVSALLAPYRLLVIKHCYFLFGLTYYLSNWVCIYFYCIIIIILCYKACLARHCMWFCTVVGGDVEKDDVHLILEYKAGETWGIYSSPRANRCVTFRLICFHIVNFSLTWPWSNFLKLLLISEIILFTCLNVSPWNPEKSHRRGDVSLRSPAICQRQTPLFACLIWIFWVLFCLWITKYTLILHYYLRF